MNVNTKTARTAGVLYIIIFVAGIVADFIIRASLIVPADATATAENIMASEGLFRLSIASDFTMILSDVAIALLFYVLLRPVNNTLALMAAFFRLAQATTLGINLLNLLFVTQLLGGADYLAVFDAEQSNALALMFLDGHATGYRIALVFFAISIAVLGYLLIKADYFPTILGIGLLVAALGYLTDSFANFLLTNYEDYQSMLEVVVFVPAVIAELALALYLLIKGVNVQRQDEGIALNTSQAEAMHA